MPKYRVQIGGACGREAVTLGGVVIPKQGTVLELDDAQLEEIEANAARKATIETGHPSAPYQVVGPDDARFGDGVCWADHLTIEKVNEPAPKTKQAAKKKG